MISVGMNEGKNEWEQMGGSMKGYVGGMLVVAMCLFQGCGGGGDDGGGGAASVVYGNGSQLQPTGTTFPPNTDESGNLNKDGLNDLNSGEAEIASGPINIADYTMSGVVINSQAGNIDGIIELAGASALAGGPSVTLTPGDNTVSASIRRIPGSAEGSVGSYAANFVVPKGYSASQFEVRSLSCGVQDAFVVFVPAFQIAGPGDGTSFSHVDAQYTRGAPAGSMSLIPAYDWPVHIGQLVLGPGTYRLTVGGGLGASAVLTCVLDSQSGNGIVGKWQYNYVSPLNGSQQVLTFIFDANNTYTSTVTANGEVIADATTTGTWHVDGNVITIVDEESSPTSGTFTISGNQLTIIGDTTTLTLTRVE
jgi:hypothetical protein